MAKKPAKDDEAADWADRAAANAHNIIRLLRSHEMSDTSALPTRAEFLGGAKRQAEAMTHAQLVDQYLSTLSALHHMLGMMMNADAQRVASGIQYSERVVEAAGIITGLADQSRRTKADRKRGPSVRDERNGTAAKRKAVKAAWTAYDKRGRGAKTRFNTAQAARHKVSPRTIEKWIAEQ